MLKNELVPDLSIIVVVHKGYRSILESCIQSIEKALGNQQDFEVVLIFNGLGEDIEIRHGFKRSQFNRIAIPHVSRAKARNIGVRESKGRILSFVDPHVTLTKNYFADVIEAIENRSCDAFVPAVQFTDAQGFFKDRFLRIHAIQTQNNGNGLYNAGVLAFPMLDTAGLTISRRCLIDLGSFDEDFDRFEDRNLGLRLFNKKYYLHGSTNIVIRKSLRFKSDTQILKEEFLDLFYFVKSACKERGAIKIGLPEIVKSCLYRNRVLLLNMEFRSIQSIFFRNLEISFAGLSLLFALAFYSFFKLFPFRPKLKDPVVNSKPTLPNAMGEDFVFWSCDDRFFLNYYEGSKKTFTFPLLMGDIFLKNVVGRKMKENNFENENKFLRVILNRIQGQINSPAQIPLKESNPNPN